MEALIRAFMRGIAVMLAASYRRNIGNDAVIVQSRKGAGRDEASQRSVPAH